jgi:hypothetical protein
MRMTAAAAVTLTVAVSVVVALQTRQPAGRPEVAQSHPQEPPVTPASQQHPARPAVTIARVRTELGIAARLAVPTVSRGTDRLPRVNDDELLARLAEAGRPAGLAYVDDRPVLVFRNGEPAGGSSRKGMKGTSIPPGL